MFENEYRVRRVDRFLVTHFRGDTEGGPGINGTMVYEIGEFPNIDMAERAARTFAEADPFKALYVTLADREPSRLIYPGRGDAPPTDPLVVTDVVDVVAEFSAGPQNLHVPA